jgi:hypothetical protein
MEQTHQQNQTMTFDQLVLLFQETEKRIEKSSLETDRKFQEARQQFQETEKRIEKSSLETDRKIQETDRQMKNLMKKMSESESRWGKFVESLVEGTLIKLLKKKKISVESTALREKKKYKGKQIEIDIIAKNGKEIVAVEVKTTLSPADIKDFMEVLKVFHDAFPDYSSKTLYGAVAYISKEGDADIFAEKQGLFVIKATGEGAVITNEKNFQPRVW